MGDKRLTWTHHPTWSVPADATDDTEGYGGSASIEGDTLVISPPSKKDFWRRTCVSAFRSVCCSGMCTQHVRVRVCVCVCVCACVRVTVSGGVGSMMLHSCYCKHRLRACPPNLHATVWREGLTNESCHHFVCAPSSLRRYRFYEPTMIKGTSPAYRVRSYPVCTSRAHLCAGHAMYPHAAPRYPFPNS